MQAGAEGAGPERAIGISIRLPFEEAAERHPRRRRAPRRDEVLLHPQADADQGVLAPSCACPAGSAPRTRPSSCSPSCRPGKATPAPVVLLDVPGGTYWTRWVEYVDRELVASRPGLAAGPRALPRHRRRRRRGGRRSSASGAATTRSAGSATGWSIRLRHAPTDDGDRRPQRAASPTCCVDGTIERTDPLPAEVADRDNLDLPRLVMRFDAAPRRPPARPDRRAERPARARGAPPATRTGR